MKIVLVLLIALFPRLALSAPNQTFTVGAVLSLTGMASSHGNAILDGVQFAIHKLKQEGWEIELKVEDDGSEPKRTVSAIERLTGQGIRFFIGPTWGILAIPAAPVIARTKSLSLQPCNSSDFVSGVNDRYFFLFTPPSRSQVLLNDFLARFQGKRVAIINNSSSWGELWGRLFRNAIVHSGAQLVIDEEVQFSENDQVIPSLITRARKEKVELILSTTTKEGVATTFKELARQQMTATVLSPDLIDSLNEKLLGGTHPTSDGYTVSPRSNPEFISQFQAWKGTAPRKYTDSGHDSLLALASAVKEVGPDAEAVKEFFESKLDRPGAAGRLKFNPNHDVEGSGYEISHIIERSK